MREAIDRRLHRQEDRSRTRLTYSADEVAMVLGISRTSVYEAIHAGAIPSIRFGRRLLVPIQRLHALIDGEDEAPVDLSIRGTARGDPGGS